MQTLKPLPRTPNPKTPNPGVKQNFARKYKIPIDTVTFSYECLPPGELNKGPEDGAYITGMFIEGAQWDSKEMMLAESSPKVLFSSAPQMLLSPCEASKQQVFPHYECPLYRTPERRGVLATTGHSTNFVMELMVPSDQPQDHWIKRGEGMTSVGNLTCKMSY